MMKLTGLKSFLLDLTKKGAVLFENSAQLFRKDSVVGIDLGASSIKLAQLARRGKNVVLVKLAIKELAAAEEGLRKDQEVLIALKDLLAGIDRKRSSFVLCFNSPENGVRVLRVPPMPRKELTEAVRLESKNYFPYSIEDSILEIKPSGEFLDGGVPKQRIVAAVACRKKVNQILELLKKSGIRPSALLPIPCALGELVGSGEVRGSKGRCLLDIGARHTEFTIFKGRELVFSRQIPIAGRDFTQAMMGALLSDRGKVELSSGEAEQIKRQFGIPQEGESRLIQDKFSTSQLSALLRSPVEALTGEIDRCLDYYREESGGERIESIELFGRGASLKGLDGALSRELGLEVKEGKPLAGIPIEAQVVSPEAGMAPFAAAMGAALSGGRSQINLLPPEFKQEMERTLRRATLQSAIVSAVLVFSFLFFGMRIQLENYRKRIAAAEMELASLELDLARARQKAVVHHIQAPEPYWEEVLREISHLIPSEAHLTELSFKSGKGILKGQIVTEEKEAVLSEFILKLEKGIFKNVRLVSAKETGDQFSSQFEIEYHLD